MAKYTLLEIVQQIASSTGSDDIVSINDSTESLQLANIVRRSYFDLIKRTKIPEHYSLVQLTETSSVTPTLMTVSIDISKLEWIKYNRITDVSDENRMELIDFLPLEEFLNRMSNLDATASNVTSFSQTFEGYTHSFYVQNDKQPSCYTSFNDNTLVFDSYDVNIESFLQSSNTMCYAKLTIPFTMSDVFVPDLDEEQFALLLNEATSLAWAELKQTAHPIAERNSKRGWTHMQKTKNLVPTLSDFDKLPNFGRK